MSPLPSVNMAYAIILGDECQKIVAATAGVLGPSPSTINFETTLYSKSYRGGGSYH